MAKTLEGYQAGAKTFKVHLDGHNLVPFFRGEGKESPRKEFIDWNDDGQSYAVSAWDPSSTRSFTSSSPRRSR
jgi:hypothetical protein